MSFPSNQQAQDPSQKRRVLSQLRLLRYAAPHIGAIVTILITMGLGVALDVLRPWPTKLLVDQVLDRKPLPHQFEPLLNLLPSAGAAQGLLLWICVGTVAIFLFGNVMTMLSTDASVKLGQQMTFELGADLFLHLQRLSLLFHSRHSTGDTISRVTGDAYCVQTLVTGTLFPLLRSIVMLITMFFIMWRMQRGMTLLSLAAVPFMILSIRIWGRSLKQSQRQRRDLEGRMMGVVQQTLSAIPAVQAFTRENWECGRFRAFAEQTVAAYRRSTMIGMWFKFFVGLVTAIATAALMWFGGRYAIEGRMSTGTILVFLSYLASLYGPLNDITYTASTWQGAAANADRVLEILDTIPEVRDAAGARELTIAGCVRYNDVSFGYEQNVPVLRHVSFEAKPGDVIAIVGPTGAGKTTLISLLSRLFDPWSGCITVDGVDVRAIPVRSLRQQVAMVLQEPFIFPLTAAENIAYGRPDASPRQITAAATAAGADAFIRRLPLGYDTIIGERGASLSGGEKQRMSIARAFVKNAPILVLDEPTSALDANTESVLLSAMESLMQGRTTFIIAHRLSTIRNASQILVLNEGRIVEQGRHDQLMAKNGLFATLYRQQMEIARHDVPALTMT